MEHVVQTPSLALEHDAKNIAQLFETILFAHAGAILFESFERLTSDVLICEAVVAQLEHAGIQVIVAEQNANSRSSAKIRSILDQALSTERLFRQARIQIARRKNAAEGGRHGGNPRYGSLPGEELILRRIKHMSISEKLGYTKIASVLNSEGIRPRNAKSWQPAVIANILGVRRDAESRSARRNRP